LIAQETLEIKDAMEVGISGLGTIISQRMDLLLKMSILTSHRIITAKLIMELDTHPFKTTIEFQPTLRL